MGHLSLISLLPFYVLWAGDNGADEQAAEPDEVADDISWARGDDLVVVSQECYERVRRDPTSATIRSARHRRPGSSAG